MEFAVCEIHVDGADGVGAGRRTWAPRGKGQIHIRMGADELARLGVFIE
jgi:hypothetical protein